VATPIPFSTNKRQYFLVSPYLPDRYHTHFLDFKSGILVATPRTRDRCDCYFYAFFTKQDVLSFMFDQWIWFIWSMNIFWPMREPIKMFLWVNTFHLTCYFLKQAINDATNSLEKITTILYWCVMWCLLQNTRDFIKNYLKICSPNLIIFYRDVVIWAMTQTVWTSSFRPQPKHCGCHHFR